MSEACSREKMAAEGGSRVSSLIRVVQIEAGVVSGSSRAVQLQVGWVQRGASEGTYAAPAASSTSVSGDRGRDLRRKGPVGVTN